MWEAAERLKITREEWEVLEGLVGKGKTRRKWRFGCGWCCWRRKGMPIIGSRRSWEPRGRRCCDDASGLKKQESRVCCRTLHGSGGRDGWAGTKNRRP
jgi:hypothetical protein